MPSSSSAGIARRLAVRRGRRAPVQPRDHLAREAHAVGVVLGEIFAEARHVRVHHGAAEFLVGRDLAGRGLQQRRAGEERLGAPAHHDHVVGQPRHVGAARGRRAVHHGDDRHARGGKLRQIVEDRAAVDEALDAVAAAGSRRRIRPDARTAACSSSASSCARSSFSRPMCWIAPASMPRVARDHHAAHAGRRSRCRRSCRRRARTSRGPACRGRSRRSRKAPATARRCRAGARRARAAAAGRAGRTAAWPAPTWSRARASSARSCVDQRQHVRRDCA